MAMKWSDVAANPAFQALSFDEQEEARNQYFNEVVAPRVSQEELDAVRGEFIADTQKTLAPPPDTGDETARLAARYKAPEKPGIIQRVGNFLKPEFKSVMEDFQPTPEQRQADVDRRLSYGAGPISQKTAAVANEVRSSRGQMVSKDPTVSKVVKAMDARGDKSFADLVDSANTPAIVKVTRDAKADEFRTAGEWATDTLSSLSQGAVGLVQLPINIIAPSSDIAATLRDTQKQLQAQESDVLKAQREQLRERVQNEDGFFDKYAATVLQLVTSPALGLSEAVKQVPNFLGVVGAARLVGAASAGTVGLAGRASPTVALGEAISGGAIQAGARAAGTTAGGIGASMVMTGGDAAGGVYEKLTDPKQTPLSVWEQNPDYQQMVASGKSSQDAIEEISTTKARMAALVTAPLGLLGFMGAEAAVASRGLGKATAEALTAAGAGKMLAKDLIGEQLEEGGTQFGGNVVSRTVNPKQSLTEGVPEAMATALVTSAPFSTVGAASQYQEARAAQAPDLAAQQQAVDLFDVNNYDPSLISPEQTTRGVADVGPSAPISFTPVGAPTQQAGLVDIVVPTAPETTDVSTLGATGGQLDLRSPAGSDQLGGGLGIPGRGADGTGQLGGGNAGLPAVNDGSNLLAGSPAGQPTPGITLPRVTARATDQDLLARTEAAIAAPENNNAVVQPVEQWVGRKGDGYVTEADATQALPGRQRMFPALEWAVEQMPSGKFRLAGYEQQNTQPAPTVGTTEAGAGTPQPTQAAPITAAAPQAVEPITAPSGKPFSTQQTAAVFAQQNGITGYSTVKMGGGWVIKPAETTLGTQTTQAIQGQAQGQAPAIGGAASQGMAGGLQPGDAAQASLPEVAGAAAPGVADNARQLASAQPELGQPLTASASEGERAAVLGGPLFSSKVKSAPISVIKLAQDYTTRQSGVEFAPVSSNNLTEQQRAASLMATLNGQTVTFMEHTGGDERAMPNGLAIGGKHVMIDVKSEDAPLAVAMHEVVHNMPDNIRKPLEGALRNLFKSGMEGDFKREFNYDDADLDKEIPAMITQAVTKRKDFWNELRQEMGNKDFSAVAELIITRLDNWVRGVRTEYGDGFVSKYVTDVEQARSLVAKAYAQSMREQGLQPNEMVASDAQPMASNRAAAETPEFKKFFGDSKVVSGDGKPLVVYHGTNQNITAFDPRKIGRRDSGFFGSGFYMTANQEEALDYADSAVTDSGEGAANAMPLYASLQNPFIWDMSDAGAATTRQALAGMGIRRDTVRGNSAALSNAKERETFNRAVREAGYDGVIVRDEDGVLEVVAFRPEQIKSATDNIGNYDPANPDIRRSNRRGTTAAGDYDVRTMKDGTIVVYGDPEQIRAQVPDDVKGRVTKDGIVFTNAAAPRVRAALEGRQVAYSRGGEVTEKLPMKDGKYLGAPEKFNTPGKIPTLRKILRQLADEGAPGRYWYENSGREVLKMVGGDVNEARKFVALLAIYSPQAKVDANSTFALRAWAQYKAGQPISVKTGVMDKKAKGALDDVDAFWSGEKTGNFFFNLLREIDTSTAGKQGATIDMWMMRAGQYETDAPSNTQYSFMENETNRLAQELGWEPQQVQAAIWVAMKARMENSGVKKRTEATSEKKGWIKFVPGKDGKGKVRVILDAQKHRDNWLKYSFEHDVTKDDTQQAKFDFGDGLKRHIGQISFEARPGRTSGVLPGIHSAPYAQQVEFQQAVQAAFLDENGKDELAAYLGLLVDSDILAPGVWQGEVSPSTQLGVAMAPAKGEEGKTNVDPAQAKALNVYAAVTGLVARQEGVGWHRPFYSSTKRDANGLDIDVGRVLNPREVADLEAAVGQWMTDNGYKGWQDRFAFISSPNGIRLVNFGIITNEKLHSDILRVAESVLPDAEAQWFASSGDVMTNNWKENKDGQDYAERTRSEGRSDVLDWARTVLAPRVQRVFDDFSDRYDWGDAGKLSFSNRVRDGGGRQGLGGAQDRQVQAPERADAQTVQGLSATDALPGAPTVRGFTGPDPRLVAVAEQYARDNGITLRRQAEYAQVDPERAARIAAAYEAMPHAPNDLRVKAAYKELIAQTLAQYRALEKAGYKFWFINLDKADNAEYASSPWNAMRDIRANKQMGVFPTDDGFGSGDFDPASNPLLEDTGIKWPSGSLFGPRKRVLANDLFRAVHDAFGHGLEGSGFRAQGEENAWQAHVRLFTGSAVAAITSETRGQNSWVNYGPNGEANRLAKVEDTVFAEQKTGLLPEFAWTEGVVGDMDVMASNRAKPTFYSQLERVISNVPAKLATQPATQWALWLDSNGPKAGVKKDEVEWSGIKDYLTLRGKDKVASAELQAYLADSGVKVTEVMRGEVDQDETYEQMARDMFDAEHYDLSPSQSRELRQAHDQMLKQSNTAYDKYTLPGGENYRELLITLPSKNSVAGISPVQAARVLFKKEYSQLTEAQQQEVKRQISDDKSTPTYMSSHWSDPNVLAHIRINDRTDADGKRVLFVEEVQSDWGQDGLKKGFSNTKLNMENPVVVFNARTGENVARFRTGAAAEAYIAEQDPTMATLDYEDTTARGGIENGMPPAAPFVTKTEGWLNLALKRIAMLAVEEGYDKVAFVNGEQSADRYDLSKQISSISYEPGSKPENEGLLQAWDLDRKMVMSEMVTTDRIEDYVGKEVAVRLLETDKVRGKHLLDGESAKVGGKGMIKFYDEIVPQAISKLLPKLGGEKLGAVNIGSMDTKQGRESDALLAELGIEVEGKRPPTQPGFDVTDKMRETVGAGLPMFSKRVAAPETAEFKKWFGDSKVVDANGEPLVVYHGTKSDFDTFDIQRLGSGMGNTGFLGAGFYFTSNDFMASGYSGGRGRIGEGSNVMPVYLSLQNPLNISGETYRNDSLPRDVIAAINAAMPSEAGLDAFARNTTADGFQGEFSMAVERDPDVARKFSENLQKAGYDGVMYDGGYEIVAFRPNQIKSATGNDGNFDATNPDIRSSNRRQKLSTIGQNFTLPGTSKFDSGRIKLQDDALRMKRVIEAVKAKNGTVGEAQNFYDANTLMPGRIQATMDDFRDNVMRPLINKAVDFGIDLDELALYAYAKHAKERNAYIASINKRFPDGGSGMTNDHADSILQLAKVSGDEAKFEELHRDLMAITSTTRQVMLAEGLISQDEFNALDGAYENYIPLRGLENVDENTGAIRPGVGRGINVRGGETIKALGRKSQASDLIENVIRDYQRVIMRVEKNDVGKVLLDFVLSNPDPDLWGVDVERSKPALNKATGLVQYTKAIEKGEDTIGVKVGGQQVYIKLADPELARAIRQAWKDETSGLERATLAMTGWWNNWMRNVLTRYNPAFAAINIPRDALWSGTAAALDELGPKGLGKYLANYGKALMASTRQESGVSGTANKIIGNQQMDQAFQEFRNAGAITGGFYMRSLEDINTDLRNEMLLAGAKSKNTFEFIKSLPPYKLATLTLKLLEFMGSASENATRFALYQAAKEVGKTPAQAALLAKNGTTNFNRKGEWGGALNNLYLFFNAGVQGTTQLAKVLKNPAVQASMAGVAGVGMMLALYGASAGGEDDDGEAYWDKIPSYVKERNLVIMLPPGDALAGGIKRAGKRGRYVTIPVQYGFNIFPNAGYMMADVYRNAQDPKRGVTPTKAALHMTSTVFGSINPFGGAIDFGDGVQVLLAAMPTLADLPIQLINERNTFGSASSPFKSPWDVRPDSERMFTSQQDSVSAKIAKALNELGGGNEGKAGSILGMDSSVAPGTIQTLISATTGGLGTFAEQVGTAVVAMTGDTNDLKANKIPFLNKFYGEVDEGANTQTARERMDKIKKLADEVKAQQKLGLDPKLTKEEDRLMSLSTMQETYQETMSQMRKYELDIIKDPKLTDAEKRLKRRTVEIDRDNLATDMNKRYLLEVPK